MDNKNVIILEFPSNLGLKKTELKPEPGVNKLPDWLKKHHFHKLVNAKQVLRLEPPKYTMDLDLESGVRNADNIIRYAVEQSKMILHHFDQNTFPIILGGDCSILIGTSLAFAQKGNFGLFFLDGHTDFILPHVSQTAGAAGMDLAIVTGHGHHKLTNILNMKPYFKEDHVFSVGNREYDQEYVQPIIESDISYFDLKKLRNHGFEHTAHAFLDMVRKKNLDGFFIHFDVDVLNDNIMPAVDSRSDDGLTYTEFYKLMKPLLLSEKAVGIEITILDPDLDGNGAYTTEFIKNFINVFNEK